MNIKNYIYSIVQIIILILSLVTDFYRPLALILMLVVLVSILDKLGKGIVLREIIALHSSFVCLVMPIVGYAVYTRDNSMARLFLRFMPVKETEYFSFALPAMTAFIITLCWPMNLRNRSDQGEFFKEIVNKIRVVLQQPFMRKVSLTILAIGTVMFFVSSYLPAAFQFVFLLFYFASFAGILYVFYSENFPRKKTVLILFILFIIVNALRSGMFTIVAYMGITLFSFFFLGKETGFFKKTVFFAAGLFILLVIQSIKPAYRRLVWRGYEGNKIGLFVSLATDRIARGDFLDVKTFFPVYYRANQGFNVALVMRRIPRLQPHDGGKNLGISFASAFVPRLLWADKPEAGGKFNMKYYAGFNLKGYSTNIGPLGEAWGSFGLVGGIVFMFFLGAFIRWAYSKLFVLSRKIPLLICWIPVLFYQVTYSAETDSLQIFNSLVKSAFFIWLLYKFVPTWFGIKPVERRAKSYSSETAPVTFEQAGLN